MLFCGKKQIVRIIWDFKEKMFSLWKACKKWTLKQELEKECCTYELNEYVY